MPKSKRDKKISLTKTDKKGSALKRKIVEDIKSCVEKYNSVYVFTFKNMRNEKMQEIREEWKPSRFFFGKNKVIAIGLGRTPEEEVQEDLHKLAKCLRGQCALLFTDRAKDDVVDWFENFTYYDIARSGFQVDRTIELKEGPIEQFSFAIEPYMRKLGLPSKLERGVVMLIKDYVVCKAGNVLTPEQAKMLELLGHRLAVSQLILKACWIKGNGFQRLSKELENDGEEMAESADD